MYDGSSGGKGIRGRACWCRDDQTVRDGFGEVLPVYEGLDDSQVRMPSAMEMHFIQGLRACYEDRRKVRCTLVASSALMLGVPASWFQVTRPPEAS